MARARVLKQPWEYLRGGIGRGCNRAPSNPFLVGRTLVNVTLKPGSRTPGVDRSGKSIVVRVREHAIEGAANDACIHALAVAYGVSRSSVELVGGFRSRRKRFAIHLPD